jgi:hypothetical protein
MTYIFALKPNSLTSGSMYNFQFTMEITGCEPSYSSVNINVNEPPSSGFLIVNPYEAIALNTSVTLTTQNWQDEDEIVSYQFGYYIDADMTSELTVIESTQKSHISTVFAAGKGVNKTILCIVICSQ